MRPLADFFRKPKHPLQRRYEALRAYLLEGLSAAEAARRFGYTVGSLRVLAARLHEETPETYFRDILHGPKERPARGTLREAVLPLRRQGLSILEISERLRAERGMGSPHTVWLILREAGIERLPRRTREERVRAGTKLPLPVADVRQCPLPVGETLPSHAPPAFLSASFLAEFDIDRVARAARYRSTRMIPAPAALRALLLLKLLFRDRKNHVMDIAEDRALAWFVGLNAVPKVTMLSAYSYWCGPRPHRSLLQALVRHRDREKGYPSLSFNLDFHTIRHYGDPGVSRLEKNSVPRRSQSVPSVLVAYAQEEGSQELVYARANLLKREKADEVVRFLEFWEGSTGKTPEELVFDSKMTTEAGLAQLVEKRVTFLTLRDRRPDEVKRVLALPDSSWKTVELDLPHREYRHPRVWEETVKLAGVPRRLRQIVARDMGKELPMFLLTNDRKRAAATLLSRYPLRTHIENSIQEQVGMFHVDALASSVRLKVEMDVVLDVLASAAYHWMAHQLRGFEKAEAITIWERFLNRGGHVRLEKDEIVLEVEPFSRAPVLLESPLLRPSTPIPWLGDRRVRVELRRA
jgi:transposase